MIKREQNLVAEKMPLKGRREDVGQLVQPVKITKDEQVKEERRKRGRPELLVQKKIKDFTDGLTEEVKNKYYLQRVRT